MASPVKFFYNIVIFMGFSFAICSILLLIDSLLSGKTEDIIAGIGGIFLFGWGSLFALNLVTNNAGTLEMSSEGLRLDSYLGIGIIPWENLVKFGKVSFWGSNMVGICIKNPEKYLESREKMDFSTELKDLKNAQKFVRTLIKINSFFPTKKIFDILISVFGYTEIPSSGEEKSIMEWNYKNFGYHIFIQSFWLEKDTEFINIANRYKEIYSSTKEASPLREEEKREEIKCPMCAELIKAEAKVCRFCYYSLSEKHFIGRD